MWCGKAAYREAHRAKAALQLQFSQQALRPIWQKWNARERLVELRLGLAHRRARDRACTGFHPVFDSLLVKVSRGKMLR